MKSRPKAGLFYFPGPKHEFTLAEMEENKKYSAESRVHLMLTMGANEISTANLFFYYFINASFQKHFAKQNDFYILTYG